MVDEVHTHIVLAEGAGVVDRTLQRPLVVAVVRYRAGKIGVTLGTDARGGKVVGAVGVDRIVVIDAEIIGRHVTVRGSV